MSKSIFFFCSPVGPADNTGYEHQIVSLAEGLKELGVPCYSNIDYWKLNNGTYLLNNNTDINFYNCDIVVYSSKFTERETELGLPKTLFDESRNYKLVYIDDEDGIITPGFNAYKNVDFVLKSHYNKKYSYPANFRPWQFGLTNRIINAVDQGIPSKKRGDILVNFRVHHTTREEAKKRILPIISKFLPVNEATEAIIENQLEQDQLYWHQTGRRHYASYYKRLTESVACACFGGYFQKSIPFQSNKLGYYLRHLDYKFKLFKFNKAYQFDSWRFWESLAAGCCTFHIDLEKYGAVLPVMPINGIHYIGVDFDKLYLLEEQLAKGVNSLKEIGEQGREWVLKYYSPKAAAERFLYLTNFYDDDKKFS